MKTLVAASVLVSGILLVDPFASADDKAASLRTPSTQIDTRLWIIHEMKEIGVRFRLPKKYEEKHWQVHIGSRLLKTFRSGHFDSLDLEQEDGLSTAPELKKLTRQADYTDYKEWSCEVEGHKIFIQSFGGHGIAFDGDEDFKLNHVEALCGLGANRLLRISADNRSKEGQQEILAMVQTLEFFEPTEKQ